MEQDMQEILFTREQLSSRIKELAAQISEDYRGKAPVVIGILRGCFIFMADLVRELDIPQMTLDFMSVSSYGKGTVSSGLVNIKLDTSETITGRDVILVEDILDTGNTLSKLVEELGKRNPASLRLCVLLDKTERRVTPIQADYVCFQIPDGFVVGCGLDYNQQYRQLEYVGILKPEIYE
ncbi:MAG: hypoxanthine phosphoribosyltransferase [Ruminiclostridium sp.]|nr:hypoxanthine phosphoribosyltransferase [Ruminiclostridium sp.]